MLAPLQTSPVFQNTLTVTISNAEVLRGENPDPVLEETQQPDFAKSKY